MHKVVERALLGITGLNQSIAEMKFYSAISGFREDELPLFREKLDFLAELASSDRKERSFQHIIAIANLPDFATNTQGINIDKLLQVRDSSEAREFRDWLGQVGDSSDEEIHERVAGLRVKAGLAAGSETGKLVRFLVTASLSLIPPTAIAGQVLGVGDQFLTEKILPRSGVAAFINKLYPSIFERS